MANQNASWTAVARRSRDTAIAPAKASRQSANNRPPPQLRISRFLLFSFRCPLPPFCPSKRPSRLTAPRRCRAALNAWRTRSVLDCASPLALCGVLPDQAAWKLPTPLFVHPLRVGTTRALGQPSRCAQRRLPAIVANQERGARKRPFDRAHQIPGWPRSPERRRRGIIVEALLDKFTKPRQGRHRPEILLLTELGLL